MYKYKELSSKKDIKKHLENPNDIISAKTTKIIFYCEGTMSKSIWTKKQKEYLDKRFGLLETRMDKLERQVKQNALGINKIIDILSRNGMK